MHKIKHFWIDFFSWKLMMMMMMGVFLHLGVHCIHRWPYRVHIQYMATAKWKKFINIKHNFSVIKYQ
jgi:hypothetical protein